MIPGRTIDRSLLCLQSLLSKTVPTPLLARPGGDAQGSMSMDSRMPLDKSSSTGAGSFGTRKFKKIESFSHSALV